VPIACFHPVVHPSVQWEHPLADEITHLELQQIYEDALILHSMPCFYFPFKNLNQITIALASNQD